MLFQVVHAHPLRDSYNHALFRLILDTLEARGHEVVATDLYRLGFEPALSPAERAAYIGGDYPRDGLGGLDATLCRADGVILCYPHWWFGMPAMMKGYIDRVWGPGIAFDHAPGGGRIRPRLDNIKVFGVVTSYGSPWWVVHLLMGNPGGKALRPLRMLCGRGLRHFHLAHYDMDRSTPASRQAFMERVRRRIARL